MSEHNRATGDHKDPESVTPADVETPADDNSAPQERDDGPVRRPLIRATLKHPEGTPPPPRQPPVFTMHQNQPGAAPARGQNRNGRGVRQGGQSNKKKSARAGQNGASRGNSAGGNKWSSRPDRAGQPRSGNRSSSRRDKGRSR